MDFYFNSFTSVEKPLLYRAYLRLLYDVFVGEQGWDLASDHSVGELMPQVYDKNAVVTVARNHFGNVIGGVRASLPGKDFPHQHFFDKHLKEAVFAPFEKKISSLNALAVKKKHRRSKYSYGANSYSLASQVLDQVMLHSFNSGTEVFLASTGTIEAAKLLRSHGFFLLDGSFNFESPFSNLVNMVFIASPNLELLDYVKNCEEAALQGNDFNFYVEAVLSSVSDYTHNEIGFNQFGVR
ncbi:MAG: hypothetical protein AB8E15_13855 [Bdellovibrionales bacterium]